MPMLSANDVILLAGLAACAKCVDQNGENPAGTTYFGFLRPDGSWFIMKQVVSGNDVSWRFKKGDSGYSAAWDDRASPSYDLSV